MCDEIKIEDLIESHTGKPVDLADVEIKLEPASDGRPIEEACDVVVYLNGKEVERFKNRIPPYEPFPVE